MPRVSSAGVNPLDAGGELIVAGYGTPTSYANRALATLGATGYRMGGLTTGAAPPSRLIDADDTTRADTVSFPVADTTYEVDLAGAHRIGRATVRYGIPGGHPGAAWAATVWDIESADALAGPWTVRGTYNGTYVDDQVVELASPVVARFWRVNPSAGGNQSFVVAAILLEAVETVGAGNQTALAPPADNLSHLVYDLPNGLPAWRAPQAAEADLGATVGEANNAASATLVATKAEHDATRAKLNALIAKLEAAGILAP